jgi:hypothetical protein
MFFSFHSCEKPFPQLWKRFFTTVERKKHRGVSEKTMRMMQRFIVRKIKNTRSYGEIGDDQNYVEQNLMSNLNSYLIEFYTFACN